MHNLSLIQAIGTWSDLEQAYFGKNHYGGDTAEIYVYRLMPYSPLVHNYLAQKTQLGREEKKEAVQKANTSLYNLLKYFAHYRNCKIKVEDTNLGKWLISAENDHRWHVQIIPHKRRKK